MLIAVLVFYFLATLVVFQGIASAIEGVRYHGYVTSALVQQPAMAAWPRVTVVVPCKGDDHELRENLEAVIEQDAAAHEIFFITADAGDPAQAVFQELIQKHPTRNIRTGIAGKSIECGEKVNNLLVAVAQADPDSEIFVFADSDARPPRGWLRELVAPLCADDSARPAATTGYRWYLPERGNPSSVLRSAWNAGIATLLGPHQRNFCWGGSMAIRRETFEQIRVREYWQHSLSDDYSMTRALRDARLCIHYVPRCLIPSRGRTRWSEVVDWSARQLIITRIYSGTLWKLAMVSQNLFALTTLLGLALLPREWKGLGATRISHTGWFGAVDYFPATTLLLVIFTLGFIRGFYRWRSIRKILSEHRSNLDHFAWAYIFLPPVVSLFSAYILWRSALTHRVEWRGRVYELVSPTKLNILK